MKDKDIKKAFQKIAKEQGVSVETVRHEIDFAITAAQENPDPQIKAFWQSIPRKGEKVTPEDVIAHIVGIAKQKENLPLFILTQMDFLPSAIA